MSQYTPYVDSTATPGQVPSEVRTVRVLLLIGAAFTALVVVGYLLVAGVSGESVGLAIWGAWPGVLGVFVARRLKSGGRARFWLVIVVASFWLLGALGEIGNGHGRGVTQLLLPVAILVLHLRRASRDFYRG